MAERKARRLARHQQNNVYKIVLVQVGHIQNDTGRKAAVAAAIVRAKAKKAVKQGSA
ncbi:hypothetical protein HG556_00035, partial [Pasteurella multocida]|nr:hypothetical protein [Pasteurella multocida]